MQTPLRTIDDVLVELDYIVEHSMTRRNRLGLFAFVYRRTTAKIKEGLTEGHFENRELMERFDVAFAKRYLDAYWQYHAGEQPTRSWQLSFDVCRKPLVLMQHVLLGMNAHINLDLGVVASEVAPGDRIFSIKNDFMRVNQLLEELIDEMQSCLGRVSRLMPLLDRVAGRVDESFIDYSIRRYRGLAWEAAVELAFLEGAERRQYIRRLDERIANLADQIAHPPSFLLRSCLRLVHYFEVKDVNRIIPLLELKSS